MKNTKNSYMTSFKITFFVLFISLIQNLANSSDEGLDTDIYFDEGSDVYVIVEKPYRYLFNKKIFIEEVQRIEKALELDGGKTQLMEFTIKGDQDLFVSRYFKKMMYDAFMKDHKVFIYTKRSVPN